MIAIKNGFTLVEIMIVVLIVALLASIAVPNILRARVNAHDAAAQAALKAIGTAFENYAATNNNYPSTTAGLTGGTPPFLMTDYFTGIHGGFTFSGLLTADTYSVTASPANINIGSSSFTITTGGVLTAN